MLDTIVLFGASRFGAAVYERLKENVDQLYFCDNDRSKWGQYFCGVKVLSPEELVCMSNIRIIITSFYSSQIALQLFQLGLKEFDVAVLETEEEISFEHYDYQSVSDMDIDENKICLVNYNCSGSNTLALYKLAPDSIRKKYKIEQLKMYEKDNDFYLNLLTGRMVIGTNGPISRRDGQLVAEMWHGFPLKCMGYMIKTDSVRESVTARQWNSLDFIASYSKLYTVLMGACYSVNANPFAITGMPRNDFLFFSNGRKTLEKLLGIQLHSKKLVLLAPTFRQSALHYEKKVVKSWMNIFGMQEFNQDEFYKFLDINSITLVLKLHPVEEAQVLKDIDLSGSRNIHILREKTLAESNTDLYEVLNAFDLLITDYSSIYFDYLLLDRPVVFTPVDLDHYAKTRGFLLEPYDFWTPGPKVLMQTKLQKEILGGLHGDDAFREERSTIKKLVHTYWDGSSSQRVWKAMDEMLEMKRI